MKKFLLKFLMLVLAIKACCQAKICPKDLEGFVGSFVQHYEFNTSGRYAHEYHPFILKKTAQSMCELELAFKQNGFNLPGRYVLMGYEANAFPQFFPRLSDCEGEIIDDEVSFKDPRGWSIQLHNRFGTMTGFLFRKINKLSQQKKCKAMFNHINPHKVEAFGDGLNILQKNIFGPLAANMFETEEQIGKLVEQKDWRAVFSHLINFWEQLYSGEYKTGDHQVAGTQDILFSIENAKFLKKSNLDLLKFFTGPDITYPIIVSSTCGQKATENAQAFLENFTQKLKPVNRQKTLYVFRSFVDGVGKSTLLGNIKNWMRYGKNVQDYQVVDNSSTLEFEIFKFDDEVFIADLPAQISHFTYKPEGMVWVDQKAVTNDPEALRASSNFFMQNLPNLQQKYLDLVAQTKALLTTHRNNDEIFSNAQSPEMAFARNLILLQELDNNQWIPFDFAGQKFLGNQHAPEQIRVFTKISEARSEGLKNVQASQMIFSDGLCFPAVYEEFVKNLTDSAKNIGIENVVFVDFLSMYSRSSRENVRINYLMQLMSLVDAKFNPYNSMYRNFTSNSELLAMLLNPGDSEQCQRGFYTEALVRFGLFAMMQEKILPGAGCRNFSEQVVVDFLHDFIATLEKPAKQKFKQAISKKVDAETIHLSKNYKNTKEFLNLYKINFDQICKFSDFLQNFFCQNFKNESLNELWAELSGEIIAQKLPSEDGWLTNKDTFVQLNSGYKARLACIFSPKNRDPEVVGKFLKAIRSAWYMSIMNLAFAKPVAPGSQIFEGRELVNQIPVAVKYAPDGRVCLVERVLPTEIISEGGQDFEVYRFEKNPHPYPLNYSFASTAYSLFGFGADVSTKKFSGYMSTGWLLTDELSRKKIGATSNKTTTAQAVWLELENDLSSYRQYFLKKKSQSGTNKTTAEEGEYEKILNDFIRNTGKALTKLDSRNSDDFEGFASANHSFKRSQQPPMLVLPQEFAPGLKMFARMQVTLEIIARDLDSCIVVTGEHESFFAALKLIELALLPEFFSVTTAQELFTSQSQPEARPVIEL